jgi:hypothetical protein
MRQISATSIDLAFKAFKDAGQFPSLLAQQRDNRQSLITITYRQKLSTSKIAAHAPRLKRQTVVVAT